MDRNTVQFVESMLMVLFLYNCKSVGTYSAMLSTKYSMGQENTVYTNEHSTIHKCVLNGQILHNGFKHKICFHYCTGQVAFYNYL